MASNALFSRRIWVSLIPGFGKTMAPKRKTPKGEAKEIKHFVEKHKNKIAIYYLPTYSPDLNPDERVWNHLKNHKLKAHQARSMKEFRPILLSKLRSIQKDSSLISSFFVGNYVI